VPLGHALNFLEEGERILLKKWTGKESTTCYVDLTYAKGEGKGSIRVVARSASGRILETLADINGDTGIKMLPISKENPCNIPLDVGGKCMAIVGVTDVDIPLVLKDMVGGEPMDIDTALKDADDSATDELKDSRAEQLKARREGTKTLGNVNEVPKAKDMPKDQVSDKKDLKQEAGAGKAKVPKKTEKPAKK